MKSCPKCNRLEPDDTLKFCRIDGALLRKALTKDVDMRYLDVLTQSELDNSHCEMMLDSSLRERMTL